ncbi:MAG: SAM-dependent chlorinase/fluorinase [Flavobacteriales bacterium]|nr:SAM-dependent chlorinase/fluorinase [Flavobacteriales bacterium]
MGIITLTTDMGTRDHYVAAVKGAIYAQLTDANIVDISHHLPPFDIAQSAFILKNSYREFPKGTVHVIGIDPEASVDRAHLVVEYEGHFFIGADNGIFSILFDKLPENIFELNISQDNDDLTFPVKDVFTKAACHIARGGTPEIIGTRVEKIQQKQMYRPIIEENLIRGSVIYIDSYGNVITNITKSLFIQVAKGRAFKILFRSSAYSIDKISRKYAQVPEGEKIALFGSSEHLEIAINKGVEGSGGGANKLFGLKMYDTVTIEFDSK